MTPTKQMTGDELAAQLFTEQGYLVLFCDRQLELGDIVRDNSQESDPATTPVRVIGESSRAEYWKQFRRANVLLGRPDRPLALEQVYFYRVEAAD
jgi:hypothetical protein